MVERRADLDRRLGQIDAAIEEAAKRGKTNTALSAIERQRKARAGLDGERNEAAATPLAALKTERASLAAKAAGSRLRPHLSGTWPSWSAPIPTPNGRSGG
jgi:hypothetical protein